MLPDDNYLFAESAIKARLAEKMPDEYVESISDSDDLTSGKHRFPGIYLIYAGDIVSEQTAGRGVASQADQHWIVVATAKDVKTLATGESGRAVAGKLFYKMLESLQGYEIASGMTLKRTTCPLPVNYDNGHIFLAASFLLTVNIVGG
jgi:hypothetical protein